MLSDKTNELSIFLFSIWKQIYKIENDFLINRKSMLFNVLMETLNTLNNCFIVPIEATLFLMLVFGCRHSEVPKIKSKATSDGVIFAIVRQKQSEMQYVKISDADAAKLNELLCVSCFPSYPSRAAISQHVRRYNGRLWALLQGKHNPASHSMRHLHVSFVRNMLKVDDLKIINYFQWKNFDMLSNYSTLK